MALASETPAAADRPVSTWTPRELAEQICTVCEVYEATSALAEQGTHVLSTDAMTGIQALERLHPSLPPTARSRRAPGVRVRAKWHPEFDRQFGCGHRADRDTQLWTHVY